MDINRFERVRSSERPAVGAPVSTGHYWAGCGYTSTYGQGDLVSDVLSVSLPWVVLRDHFNCFHSRQVPHSEFARATPASISDT